MDFITSLVSVSLLIALAAPGYFLRKLKLVSADFVGGLVNLLLYVCSPFLTIASFMRVEQSRALYADMGIVCVLGFFMLALAWLMSRLCFTRFKDGPERRVCIAAGFMNNSGFMGVPVLQAFYPGVAETIVFVAMYTVALNIVSWTLLVTTVTGDKRFMRFKAALVNPGTISFVIALALMVFRVQIPPVLKRAIFSISDMTTPVSMLVIGTRFADIKLRELFRRGLVFYASLVKLVFVPVCTLGFLVLVKQFVSAGQMAYNTMFILSAMPSAAFVIAFCEKFNADKDTSVKCVVLSSLLSVITIPFMMLLIGYLG
jgi:predicted permease